MEGRTSEYLVRMRRDAGLARHCTVRDGQRHRRRGRTAGLGAWVLVILLGLQASDDYLRSVSGSRERARRFIHPSWKDLDRDDWITREAKAQRKLIRWIGIPFTVLWTSLAAATLFVGLTRF